MKVAQNPPLKILTHADLQSGLRLLRDIDPLLVPIIDGLEDVPLRNRAPGFEGLAEIVVSQHVSKASAAAVFGRLMGAVVPLHPQPLLECSKEALIATGLSRAKQNTLKAIATAVQQDGLDLHGLCEQPVEEAQRALTALPGIGPWTAEVFLMFCAGHADIFPAGDVALQHVAGDVLGLTERPDEKAARAISERWRPVRSVAARLFYARYAQQKGRSALPV
ncbi:MAG: DNA-3-methyladenine glycosylase 2 family protein [Ahrensia sp.]|nr:DNA-3-methyladenine glycosylase 2 family protein [Ahrensia sp.]